MRKIAIISAVATILLFSFATRTYATRTDNEPLSALQSLISREIPYDANTPIDSIIFWTNQLAPTLKFPRTEESYFTLLLWQVSAYIMRGDLSLAVDRARYMYESAKDMNSNFGIALANQAIGQAYTNLSTPGENLHSFATDEPIGRGHDVCKSPEPTSGTAARTSARHSHTHRKCYLLYFLGRSANCAPVSAKGRFHIPKPYSRTGSWVLHRLLYSSLLPCIGSR